MSLRMDEQDLPPKLRAQLNNHKTVNPDTKPETPPQNPKPKHKPTQTCIPLEAEIQNQANQYAETQDVKWMHTRPAQEIRRDGTTHWQTATTGTLQGWPDVTYARNGQTVFIEYKRPGQTPSEQQMQTLIELGGVWTDNVEDAKTVIDSLTGGPAHKHDPHTRKIVT